MNKIKFVYFDVGGVLIVDFTNNNKWTEMKKDLGVNIKTEKAFDSIWKKYRRKLCVGFDIDTIIPEFENETGLKFPNGYSMLEDFVNRFEQNPSIWPAINLAKKNYKAGLLTNMYPRMLDLIKKNELFPDIDWDVIIDSSLVGSKKPDDQIFEIAEEKSGVKPEEILFIDNLLHNTQAAEKRGWQAYTYDDQNPHKSSKELLDILSI
ncbi:MAG: HAD-IA family hydrolase [Candidatus Pacebacteria bacterium]|jgi:epoxide hydrolase-like predicted phosphatase|nr:HAD-IA family hydrolase [Candidatus Paceibacterota bacterium]MBT3512222.1 HAD-IA family hydrolase [Candidatus Paceibacterota bacterium]MBT4004548.1 HAD-IA family hydrolase [Candidatus Paceibacterota bacterium]MBT4359204.1 HAD-IA family hydrolase [Candidatus Paceibacterota bacterium]MBT4681090.1 HAD-IA family hydrolase [Candidatus Paceibacterota bacterium]